MNLCTQKNVLLDISGEIKPILFFNLEVKKKFGYEKTDNLQVMYYVIYLYNHKN